MTAELLGIEQQEGENLRDYIARFNIEAATIPDIQQEIAVLALMSGLRDSPFRQYMGRKNFTTLTEVLRKANEYIRTEEFYNHGEKSQGNN